MLCVEKNTHTNKLNKDPENYNSFFFLYTLYFILKPYYFWSSGLPQISDFIMVFLIVYFLFKKRFRFSMSSETKIFRLTGLLFVSYVVFINLFWALTLSTTDRFIFSSIFYIYNFIVVLFLVAFFSEYKEKVIRVTYNAALLSVFIQLLAFFAGGGFSGGRVSIGFNNPNQLGYYSLLIMSLLLYSSVAIRVQVKWFILGVFAAFILVFASLSKSAILSCLGLLLFYVLFPKKNNEKFKWRLLTILLVVGTTSIIVYETTTIIQDNQLIQSVQNRIDSIGVDSDDSLEGRGYYRITEYPQYWLFGAGEGEYSRFRHYYMEFHSTLGNIQVSYGLIGTLLFISFILIALKNDKYRSWYIIFFIMTYGFTHNGIRNSMLWILFALIACAKVTDRIGTKEANDR